MSDVLKETKELLSDARVAPVTIFELWTACENCVAEVVALRARLTLTPERIEAAAKAAYTAWSKDADNDWLLWERQHKLVKNMWLIKARAALLAAGMEEKTP